MLGALEYETNITGDLCSLRVNSVIMEKLSLRIVKIAQISVALCNYNIVHVIVILILTVRKVRVSRVM